MAGVKGRTNNHWHQGGIGQGRLPCAKHDKAEEGRKEGGSGTHGLPRMGRVSLMLWAPPLLWPCLLSYRSSTAVYLSERHREVAE